jgi:hypothetical protein
VNLLAEAGLTALCSNPKTCIRKNLPLFDENLPVVKEGRVGKPDAVGERTLRST